MLPDGVTPTDATTHAVSPVPSWVSPVPSWVEICATSVFPTTKVPLLGGPAIGNVRIALPMPTTEPVWLEIVAEPLVTQQPGRREPSLASTAPVAKSRR